VVGPICILLYTLPLTPTPPLPLAAASLPFLFDLSNITKIKILLLPPPSLSFFFFYLKTIEKEEKKDSERYNISCSL
jgi:hypothetical protein